MFVPMRKNHFNFRLFNFIQHTPMGKLIIPKCHVPNLERVHVIYNQSACYYEIYLVGDEKEI